MTVSPYNGAKIKYAAQSVFAQPVCGDPSLDIGELSTTSKPESGVELLSQYQVMLNKLYKISGCEQVIRRLMKWAPHWILEKAV